MLHSSVHTQIHSCFISLRRGRSRTKTLLSLSINSCFWPFKLCLNCTQMSWGCASRLRVGLCITRRWAEFKVQMQRTVVAHVLILQFVLPNKHLSWRNCGCIQRPVQLLTVWVQSTVCAFYHPECSLSHSGLHETAERAHTGRNIRYLLPSHEPQDLKKFKQVVP